MNRFNCSHYFIKFNERIIHGAILYFSVSHTTGEPEMN